MPLDDLVQVIEIIQQRIRDYGDSLRQNEIRTRVALIDPLLTVLGWDVSDPGLVTAEYGVAGGRADYAFRDAGHTPAATLEAKKLGETLEPHRLQMLNYSNAAGIRFAGLTDGNIWELYEIFKQGSLEERRILNVALTSEAAFQCALKFLLLWRPNLGAGSAIAANEPIFSLDLGIEPDDDDFPIDPTPLISNDAQWAPLSQLQHPRGSRPPTHLHLPSGEEKRIGNWSMLFAEVAEWLVDSKMLTPIQCPVRFRHRQRYLVHTEAVHFSGTSFKRSFQLSNGLFCEFNWKAEEIVDAISFLLERFGQDPATVLVRVD